MSEITADEYRRMEAERMREIGRGGLQERVRTRAVRMGWRFYHTWNSQKSAKGFPDCIMLKGGRHVVIELKRQDERKYQPSDDQVDWLNAYADIPGTEVYLFRPLDLFDGTIDHVLGEGPLPDRFWRA